MTPHNAFIRDMWWLLQAIKKETLAGGPNIEFHISEKDATPAIATQRNILRRMRLWDTITSIPSESLNVGQTPTELLLKIDRKFHDLYSLIENSLKLEIPSERLYQMTEDYFHPMSYAQPNAFHTWNIIKGKVRPEKHAKAKSGMPTEPIFKLPDGTKWQDIEIKFKNRFEVDIFAHGKFIKSTDHIELGFFKSGTKDRSPDKQWTMLHALAMIYTVAAQQKITPPTSIKDFSRELGSDNTVMKIKEKLSRHLQAIFNIKNDPFEDYKDTNRYRTKFKLIGEPELRHERLHESNQSYDDSLGYEDSENIG